MKSHLNLQNHITVSQRDVSVGLTELHEDNQL